MGINYVYSNSGKTFQYGLVPNGSNPGTPNNVNSGSGSGSSRQHLKEYTTDINITTTMNR